MASPTDERLAAEVLLLARPVYRWIATRRRRDSSCELAAEGMNLEGIRRVMALEAEVDILRAEVAQLRAIASEALAEAERRAPRRDLVPLRQQVAVFGSGTGRTTTGAKSKTADTPGGIGREVSGFVSSPRTKRKVGVSGRPS